MITVDDSLNTLEFDNHFVIAPINETFDRKSYMDRHHGKEVERGFYYSSGENTSWLKVEENPESY